MKRNRLIQLNSSMGYILRCEDGSTIVIDGGKEQHADVLMAALRELCGKENPVVDLWILTHPHNDHTFACKAVAEGFSESITVKKLLFRFPDMADCKALDPVVPEECRILFEACKRFSCGFETPSAGDCYEFGGLRIEVLFTCADLPSLSEDPGQNLNDASLVFRVIAEGQSLLITGDISASGCRVLCDRYGELLKSQVCQVSHHGWFGATTELYDLVDPEILLWPADLSMYEAANTVVWPSRYLLDELRVKQVYLAGEGTEAWDLPLRIPSEPRIPPVPSRHRCTKPLFFLPKAPDGFDWRDSCSEVWQACDPLPGVSFRKNQEEGNCFVRLCWSEKALFGKVNFEKRLYPSSPKHTGTGNTNNVRLYLSETVISDLFCSWEQCPKEGNVWDLKLFPDYKEFPFGLSQCNYPDFTCYLWEQEEKGFTLCFSLPFSQPHRAGDRIGATVEVSACNPEGTGRVCRYLLTAGEKDDYCARTPSALPVFQLV